VADKILPGNASRDTAFTWQVTASGSLAGGTSATRDTWDGQPALAPDGRTIVDGSAFGRPAVGLWELLAAAGQPQRARAAATGSSISGSPPPSKRRAWTAAP
jgi:hypothetical protein